MTEIHERLVEGSLSDTGRRVLTWLASNPDKLDHVAANASPEPYWNYVHQAERALGVENCCRNGEYLGYAVQEILAG